MDGTPNIAKIGALLGDNTRARMLTTLMHGKALTASELAREAGVTAQTATSHLAKLHQGGLLVLQKQGRHKYFALANAEVATLLETLMGLSADSQPLRTIPGPRDTALRNARVCYNHLAGNRGIQLYDSLVSNELLTLKDGNVSLSENGREFMTSFGIDVQTLSRAKAPMCRQCLDWSERRSHLAGSVGRALLTRFEQLKWLRRVDNSRIVQFTKKGLQDFDNTFSF